MTLALMNVTQRWQALCFHSPFYLRVKYGPNEVDDRCKCHKGSPHVIKKLHVNVMGRSRSITVGIATRYPLDDLKFEYQQGKR